MTRALFGEGLERKAQIKRRLRVFMLVQWRVRRVSFLTMTETVSETGADPDMVLAEWRKLEEAGEAWIDYSRRRLPSLWRERPVKSPYL